MFSTSVEVAAELFIQHQKIEPIKKRITLYNVPGTTLAIQTFLASSESQFLFKKRSQKLSVV